MRLQTGKTMQFIILMAGVAALALMLTEGSANAWVCDKVTGGGWIVRPNGEKANFGVGGGCKHGSPTWGHLNYLDHGNAPPPMAVPPPFHVHATSITGYFEVESRGTEGKPKIEGTRDICGRARTNHPMYPEVDFRVRVTDNGEPGRDDIFIIRLGVNGTVIYTTEGDPDHTLGGSGSGGGNIQLHKPNPSTSGAFGGECRI